ESPLHGIPGPTGSLGCSHRMRFELACSRGLASGEVRGRPIPGQPRVGVGADSSLDGGSAGVAARGPRSISSDRKSFAARPRVNLAPLAVAADGEVAWPRRPLGPTGRPGAGRGAPRNSLPHPGTGLGARRATAEGARLTSGGSGSRVRREPLELAAERGWVG